MSVRVELKPEERRCALVYICPKCKTVLEEVVKRGFASVLSEDAYRHTFFTCKTCGINIVYKDIYAVVDRKIYYEVD